MFFRKKIQRSCSYCAYATKIDDEQVLCAKKGLNPVNGKCRKFCYDPCKRIPPKPKATDFKQFDQNDYSL